MAGKIKINSERCKGCGLCIVVCPKKGITVSKKSNRNGYFPAQWKEVDCTGCAMCAIICPDAAIEVYRDENGSTPLATGGNEIVEIELPKKHKANLARGKV